MGVVKPAVTTQPINSYSYQLDGVRTGVLPSNNQAIEAIVYMQSNIHDSCSMSPIRTGPEMISIICLIRAITQTLHGVALSTFVVRKQLIHLEHHHFCCSICALQTQHRVATVVSH